LVVGVLALEYAVMGLSGALALSLCLNGFLALLVRRLKKTPPPQQTYDALQLMHDLTAGSALVQIKRIAPENMYFFGRPNA
jgi:hypothetical protein